MIEVVTEMRVGSRLRLLVLLSGGLKAALSGALVALERRLVRWQPG